ncbi:MAG: hypothetical protein U1E34_10160 [Amaricoccus sp.]
MTKRERKMQARFERQQREVERIRRLTEDAADRRAMEAALDTMVSISAEELVREDEEMRQRQEERRREIEALEARARDELRDFSSRRLLDALRMTRQEGTEMFWSINQSCSLLDYLSDRRAFKLVLDEIDRRHAATAHEKIRLVRLDREELGL